jgi:competence protein ComEC
VRTASGRLAIVKKGGDAFAVKEWLAADADSRSPGDLSLAHGVACDEIGCVVRLADGSSVALALHAEAIAEDCRKAALVVTTRNAPGNCAATIIDRMLRAQSGALALRRVGSSWEVAAARPDGYDRPWSRANARSGTAGSAQPPSQARPARDATPRSEDLEPGD